jgi:urea transporter
MYRKNECHDQWIIYANYSFIRIIHCEWAGLFKRELSHVLRVRRLEKLNQALILVTWFYQELVVKKQHSNANNLRLVPQQSDHIVGGNMPLYYIAFDDSGMA